MKKLAIAFAVGCLLFASAEDSQAHYKDILYFMWQWPEGLPIQDADLSEWDVVPEEYRFTTDDVGDSIDDPGTKIVQDDASPGLVTTGIDPSRLSFRYVPSANVVDDRFHWAYERFDDSWSTWSDIEPKIDADHSGGWFWVEEGMTDEEGKRAKARGAQPYHLWFSDGVQQGPGNWAWLWMTPADWYEDPRFMTAAYTYTGEPLSDGEFHLTAEFALPGFNDFKWDDPDYSFDSIHDIQEGDIVGITVCLWDSYAGCPPASEEGAECYSKWNLTDAGGNDGIDADLWVDFVVMELDHEALATAVEEYSWGAIKASVKAPVDR